MTVENRIKELQLQRSLDRELAHTNFSTRSGPESVDQAKGQSVRTCPHHGDSSVKSKSLLVKRRSQAQVLCANFSSVGQGSLVGT
ncbi:hypothetical protein M8J76_006548 [Diaphorina citri]|nr:hypothetical protein M8J75_009414 [Diaphorina citri]KAI5719193.1 hypothetical protein M8J76_006548 [Diaphorina citri]